VRVVRMVRVVRVVRMVVMVPPASSIELTPTVLLAPLFHLRTLLQCLPDSWGHGYPGVVFAVLFSHEVDELLP
jgi:hypothetical protein